MAPLFRFIGKALTGWFTGWFMLVLFGMSGFLIGAALAGVAGGLSLGMLAVGMWFYWQCSREAARRRLMRDVCARLHDAAVLALPLPQALEAMAAFERGRLRRRLGDLAQGAAAGVPLAEAVEIAVPEASRRDVALLRAAGRTGRLGPMLAQLDRRPPQPVVPSLRGPLLAAPLTVLLFLVCGAAVFVAPKFIEIANDYSVRFSWLEQRIFTCIPPTLGHWVGVKAGLLSGGWPSHLVTLGWLLVLCLPMLFNWWGHNGLKEWRGSMSLLAWPLPFIGQPVRDGAQADAALILAESLRAGSDGPSALRLAAEAVPWPLARRLRATAGELEAGAAPARAAAGLPATLRLALAGGQVGAAVPEMLDAAHRCAHGRAEAGRAALLSVGSLAALICLGALAGLFAMAFFMVEVRIIRHLIDTSGATTAREMGQL